MCTGRIAAFVTEASQVRPKAMPIVPPPSRTATVRRSSLAAESRSLKTSAAAPARSLRSRWR